MPSRFVCLRRNLVLLTAYVSAQCVLLEKLTPVYEIHYFLLLVCSTCGLYLAVLWQQEETFHMALEYEQLLQRSQLLELKVVSFRIITVFAIFGMFVTLALLAELPFSPNPPLSFLLLLGNMVLRPS